jgi:glycosyltransferase involved in cell wall biosynthesis
MISFVVPAHNEEQFVPGTIRSLHAAARALGEPYEIVVVDDASTDATAAVSTREGAVVVPVNYRQIAATRHAGVRAAKGHVLVFVDADTSITNTLLAEALQALAGGAVGGAAIGVFDGALPLYARAMTGLWSRLARAWSLTPGCFLFCTRHAYEAAGGFDLSLFVFEDVALGRALRTRGRVVILQETVTTSGRNLRAHSLRDAVTMLLFLARDGRAFFRDRRSLEYWYGSHR